MRNFIFLFLFEIINSGYQKIDLKFENPLYYIPLKICEILEETYFLFSTHLPFSFYPTINCEICTQLKLNETKLNLVLIKDNINIPYYHNNYSGNIYRHKISIENLPPLINESIFIGFDKVTYKSNFSYNGIFSLSYLNYNFNTTEKIFAFHFIKDNCQLHLGGYETSLIKQNDNLKSFDVIIDKDNSNNKYYNPIWYIQFQSVTINDSPYIMNNNNIKLTFDIGSDKLHLPKRFFFDNMKKLFPEKSHCQIHPDGYFKCECGDNYQTVFGNITFYGKNGENFTIYPVDYIVYEVGLTGSTCTTKIKINYENDLFVAGNVVLKNYYTIFDVDNKSFLAYRNVEKDDNLIIFFILILIIIGVLAILILGIYFCRKKFRHNNTNINYENEGSQESDNDEEENDIIYEDDNIDNIREPINPGQGESSEETE